MDWQETAAIDLILKRHKKTLDSKMFPVVNFWSQPVIVFTSVNLYIYSDFVFFDFFLAAAAVVVYVITSLCE